jgi:hypothetical protein
MARVILCIAFCASFALASPAQERQGQEIPARSDPKACAPGERLKPGEQGLKAPETTGQNLSDRLARTEGVLCPPNVDPEIQAPTPDVGRTPVIPPPGTPGGDPTLRPK